MNVRYLQLRNGIYYYRRVFPGAFKKKFSSNAYVISLDTRSLDVALQKRSEHNQAFARLMEVGDGDGTMLTEFQKLANAATRLNFPYTSIDITAKKIDDPRLIFESTRLGLEAISKLAFPTQYEVAAAAGIAKQKLTFDEALAAFKEYSKDKWMYLSKREQYKKVRPFVEAVTDFKSFMPEHDLLTLAKRDTFRYRDDLIKRVSCNYLKPETANRKIMRLRLIVRTVFEVDHPELVNPFVGVNIKEEEAAKRPPFTEDEIRDIRKHVYGSDASDEIKAIIAVAMNTGTAPKELVLMEAADICLNDAVPHIKIRPNENRRKVKSGGARHREIPLLGDALLWMRKFPDGFPRYKRDNGGEAASAAANQLIKHVSAKTFYSFRHRLKDLMRNAQLQDSLQDAIMGHTERGMGGRYGHGYSLTTKQEALARALNLTPETTNL